MNFAFTVPVTRAVPSVSKQNRIKKPGLQKGLCLVLAVLTLAFSGSAARAASDPIPGVDIIVRKKPGGLMVGRGKTDKEGKAVIRNLGPGDYWASASINTSRSNIKRPGVVIEFSGGDKPVAVSVDLAHGTLEKIPFTVPEGKKQSITLTLTDTGTEDNAPQAADESGAMQDVSTTREPGTPIPGVPIGLEGDPGSVIVARGVTEKNGKVVFRDLAPGDYYASAAINTSRSNIKRRGVVILIEFSGGGEPVWANVSNAKAVKILCTVPEGKKQSITLTLTEGSGKDKANAAPPR